MSERLVLIARLAVIVVAVGLSLVRFAAIDADSHSVSDTLRPWLIETTVIAVLAGMVFAAVGRRADRAP
jgi:hypothetical protein